MNTLAKERQIHKKWSRDFWKRKKEKVSDWVKVDCPFQPIKPNYLLLSYITHKQFCVRSLQFTKSRNSLELQVSTLSVLFVNLFFLFFLKMLRNWSSSQKLINKKSVRIETDKSVMIVSWDLGKPLIDAKTQSLPKKCQKMSFNSTDQF